MNEKVIEFLESLRNVIAFIAASTPTKYDDELVKWIDYILGRSEQLSAELKAKIRAAYADDVKAQGILDNVLENLPWEMVWNLVKPIILELLKRWLEEVTKGGGGGGLPAGLYFPNDDHVLCS